MKRLERMMARRLYWAKRHESEGDSDGAEMAMAMYRKVRARLMGAQMDYLPFADGLRGVTA